MSIAWMREQMLKGIMVMPRVSAEVRTELRSALKTVPVSMHFP